jgi:cytochrome P450
MQHLTQSCPLLDSTLREVLRLYTSSASMRLVLEDTVLNDKVLRKGNKVMIPYRALHENPDVWGSDAQSFNARRFLKNRALLRDSSYRPFGGGATLCAGRFVAVAEVLSFVGTALHRYDFAAVAGRGFPKADTMKPTFGMMAPRDGDDLRVLITRRQ